MAAGVVRKAAFERGFGNLVIVDHRNGLLSFYAHLSRFAKGLKAGARVDQKQVVGFVGMTGLATGPHLHFGVKKNGGWVNPDALKMTRDAPVPARSMSDFKKQVAAWKSHLERVAIPQAPTQELDDTNDADDATDGDDEAPGAPTSVPPVSGGALPDPGAHGTVPP